MLFYMTANLLIMIIALVLYAKQGLFLCKISVDDDNRFHYNVSMKCMEGHTHG